MELIFEFRFDVFVSLDFVAVVEAHLLQGPEVDGLEYGLGGLGPWFDEVFTTEQEVVLRDKRNRILGDVALFGDHFVSKVFFQEIDHLEASAGVALASGLPHKELRGEGIGAFPLEFEGVGGLAEAMQLVAVLGHFVEELRLHFEIDFCFDPFVIFGDQRSTFVVEASHDRVELAHDETFEGVVGHVGEEIIVDRLDLECDGGRGFSPGGLHQFVVGLEVDVWAEDIEGSWIVGRRDRRIKQFGVCHVDLLTGGDVRDFLPALLLILLPLSILNSFKIIVCRITH